MIFPYLASDSQELMELCDIAKYVSLLKLNRNDYELLLHFAVRPATSAYEYADPIALPSAKYSSNPDDTTTANIDRDDTWIQTTTASIYRDTKNQTRRLTKLKLIERVLDQPSLHKVKKYKLTKNGVYLVIKSQLTPAVIVSLLMDYGDHPMFRYFVYPWISRDTLLHVSGSSFFSDMCSYLRDCCEAVENTNNFIDLEKHLFAWDITNFLKS